eukprot:CAMPEP_0197551030 /NCGR_PEP_ID=MMETSP1320-20131121/4429_1 /TAXON_ID=91990 /ORGANISM="Bolidomonas sp., Strain RCC2347" /LENGTH=714 /DNA_ID=CAMNT_0043111471 /DNA_START=140 /DNA_END=2281 /DNA_ORIENTATION=+
MSSPSRSAATTRRKMNSSFGSRASGSSSRQGSPSARSNPSSPMSMSASSAFGSTKAGRKKKGNPVNKSPSAGARSPKSRSSRPKASKKGRQPLSSKENGSGADDQTATLSHSFESLMTDQSSPTRALHDDSSAPPSILRHEAFAGGAGGAASLSSSVSVAASAQSLQSKLIQLSLSIEDQEKTVQILTQEMDRVVAEGEEKQKDIAARGRVEFKRQAERYKGELGAKLAVCDEMTARKQELASSLKRLQGKIKLVEDRTAAAAEKVRKEGGAEIDEAAASWGEGEAIRREKWIDRKTKEIREITIKGLEPEVERIIEKHKQDCLKLDDQFELKKRDFLVAHHKEMDAKTVQNQEKAMKKYDAILTTVRVAGNDRLAEVHEDHAKNLAKLRKRLGEETDSQRVWQSEELKRLAEAHADELQNVRSSEAKRLHEMRRRWIEEKDAAERQLSSAISSVESDSNIAKEHWESKIRHKVEKESLDNVAAEREKMRKERDREIEREIRRVQGVTAKFELECKEKLENEKRRLKSETERKLKGIGDKKSRWSDKIGENLDVVRDMQERKRSCESTLKALEDYMKKMDDDIEKVIRSREEELARITEDEDSYKMNSTNTVSSLHTMRASLKSQIEVRRNEIEQLQMSHKARVESLGREHDKDLLAVERRVKIDVGLKETRIHELREMNAGMESKVEQLKGMIESYKKRTRKKREEARKGRNK